MTQGRRPDHVRRGLESLLRQRDVDLDVVVVANGCEPAELPPGVRAVALSDNVGAAAGRNAGVPHVRGELLLFLDDDASLASDNALARLASLFAAEPALGLVQPRVVDPSGAPPPRRWVPRLRVGDRSRSSYVTAVWEGAVVTRREVFEQVGGWPEQFIYFHEGIDLAWRVWDAGYRVRYAGDVTAHHPAPTGARHEKLAYLSSRNRMLLARCQLPLPLAVAHVAAWLLPTAARLRSLHEGREVVRGYIHGLREPCSARRLRWRTIWRMTRAGRPPVI